MPHEERLLIAELARLLSRELLLNVPAEELSALTEASKALRATRDFLGSDTPPMVQNFLSELSKVEIANNSRN